MIERTPQKIKFGDLRRDPNSDQPASMGEHMRKLLGILTLFSGLSFTVTVHASYYEPMDIEDLIFDENSEDKILIQNLNSKWKNYILENRIYMDSTKTKNSIAAWFVALFAIGCISELVSDDIRNTQTLVSRWGDALSAALKRTDYKTAYLANHAVWKAVGISIFDEARKAAELVLQESKGTAIEEAEKAARFTAFHSFYLQFEFIYERCYNAISNPDSEDSELNTFYIKNPLPFRRLQNQY